MTAEARCDRCRRERPGHDLTRQRGRVAGEYGELLCSRCVNEINAAIRAAAALARREAPRCECCQRRGTWRVSGVLLCGVHKKRVETNRMRQTARWGIVGLLGAPPLTRDQVLDLARAA